MKHLEAGHGIPLVHLQPAGALRLTPMHTLLARQFRVVALETTAADPATIANAIDSLGVDSFNLMATGGTAPTALALASLAPSRVLALVLEAPAPLAAGAGAALTTPTLVLVGTTDDATAQIGRTHKQRLPNAHLVFVYDAGHEISAARPEAFAEVVTDFLERGEAFVISRSHTVIHP